MMSCKGSLRGVYRGGLLGWPAVLVVVMLVAVPGRVEAAGGTNFILEGEGGVGMGDTGSFGQSLGVTAGWGSGFGGGLRVYAVGHFGNIWASEEKRNGISVAQWDTSDSMMMLGWRLYIAINSRFRIMTQFLGGYAWSSSDWDINGGMERYGAESSAIGIRYGLGFQYRFMREMSVGFGVDRVTFWGKDEDLRIASITSFTNESDESDQTRFLLSVAYHF